MIDEWTATIRSAAREALQAEHEPGQQLMSSSGTARTGRRPSNPTAILPSGNQGAHKLLSTRMTSTG